MKYVTKIVLALVVVGSICSQVSALVFNKNLGLGSRGEDVKVMQQFLISQNLLTGSVTGYFGPQTKKAVQVFQKQNKLAVNGSWFSVTRQKADALLSAASTSAVISQATSIKNTMVAQTSVTVSTSTSLVTVTLVSTQGGFIFSQEMNSTCYSYDICKVKVPSSKKITLQAFPAAGYLFKGWSEASCGSAKECSVTIPADTTIYATFEVATAARPAGRFLGLDHPVHTCYLALGRENCDLRLSWNANTARDITINRDGDEYFLGTEENYTLSPLDPEDLAGLGSSSASLPFYFSFPFGLRALSLKSGGEVLDTLKIDVQCAPGNYWDGTKCWEKGANFLYLFKTKGFVFKTNPSGIKCGYAPDVCAVGFSSSTMVTITVIPLPGYSVGEWYGDCSGVSSTCTVRMDKMRSVGMKIK